MSGQKKHLSTLQIIEEYKNGKRDFSNIICIGGIGFANAKLSGCNFRKSNISYCNFDDADLSDCDFTEANLEWSSFQRVDLRRSDFTKANLSWSVLNKAKVEKATFNNANISWCLLFDVDFEKTEKKNTDFTMSAFRPSDITKEGRAAVMKELAKKKNLLPFELYYELEYIIKTGTAEIEKAVNITEAQKNPYQISAGFGYGIAGTNAVYNVQAAPAGYILSVGGTYTAKGKKTDAYFGIGGY